MYSMIYDRAYCKRYNIDFSPKRLYYYYSNQTGISRKDIDEMREDLGDIKTNQFLKQRVRYLLIEKLKWS